MTDTLSDTATEMQENQPPDNFDKTLYQFLLRPSSPPSDILRVASLYHGGAVSAAVEELGFEFVWEHYPSDTGPPNFDNVPFIDFLVATIPDPQGDAIDLVMRYLRVRRPWVFLLVREDEDATLLWRMQEGTHRLGYFVSRNVSGGMSFLVGTLGEDLPDQTGGESLVGRIIRECAEGD